MKIGDEVEIVKEVTFDGGRLEVGTKGLIGNIVEEGEDKYVVFVIQEPLQVYVLKSTSVK